MKNPPGVTLLARSRDPCQTHPNELVWLLRADCPLVGARRTGQSIFARVFRRPIDHQGVNDLINGFSPVAKPHPELALDAFQV